MFACLKLIYNMLLWNVSVVLLYVLSRLLRCSLIENSIVFLQSLVKTLFQIYSFLLGLENKKGLLCDILLFHVIFLVCFF